MELNESTFRLVDMVTEAVRELIEEGATFKDSKEISDALITLSGMQAIMHAADECDRSGIARCMGAALGAYVVEMKVVLLESEIES